MTNRVLWRLGLVLLVGTAACADLDVQNPNAPDTRRVAATPSDVEGLIASAFRTWWNVQEGHPGGRASITASVMADEHSSSWGNFGMRELGSEPRIAIPNTTTWTYNYTVESPWYGAYAALKGVNDGLRAIDEGMVITGAGGTDQTARARAFAKFVQGVSLGHLAALFDQAYLYDETVDLETDVLELRPFSEVAVAALASLQAAVDVSTANTFTIPDTWVNGVEISNTRLAQIARSYMARLMAGMPRNPQDRAAVDWAKVVQLIDAGITEDFGPVGDAGNNWWSWLKTYATYSTWSRMDMRTLGQGDISGEYEKWMALPVAQRNAIVITSPDKRVMGAAPKTSGKYVRYHTTSPFLSSRGNYHQSFYSGEPMFEGIPGYFDLDTETGLMATLTVDEMRLLKAEGLIRQGQNQAAAELINVTRVAEGQLPPVTAAGPPDGPATCVPQNPDGTCGNLFQALKWEKLLETWHKAPYVHWWDRRGWGDLVTGTALQFPVPAKELQVLELPVYTFGGTAGSAAPNIIGSGSARVQARGAALLENIRAWQRSLPGSRGTAHTQ